MCWFSILHYIEQTVGGQKWEMTWFAFDVAGSNIRANWSGACHIMNPVKMRITAEYNGQKELNMMLVVKTQLQNRPLTITRF